MRIAAVIRCRNEAKVLPWTLANLRFADLIHVCDSGSDDGTQGLLAGMQQLDGRITLSTWDNPGGWYERQWEHWNYALSCVPNCFDWYWIGDADEVPSAELQTEIRSVFATSNPDGKTVVELPFLYVRQGWTEYYSELSRWPATRCFDHRPGYEPDESKKELALAGLFEKRRVFAYAPPILHFNLAMTERYARKQEIYLQHFGYSAPDPDKEYGPYTPLPDCHWYSPGGFLVGPEYMQGVEL